jgi:hypothetical protein
VSASLGRDVVVLACAISAGIHGALAPSHLAEGALAGAGFLAATGALAVLAFLLTRFPAADLILVAAALTLAALIASYAFAVTTGLPLLHPEAEPVDGLALVTKAIEVVGVLAAWRLLRRRPVTALIHAPTNGV